jgi:hypothetical protein
VLDIAPAGLTFRLQLTDKRNAESFAALKESFAADAEPVTALSGGLYYKGSRTGGGSSGQSPGAGRILWGPVNLYGAAARLRTPWSRGAPFADSREASSADLKTTSQASAVNAFYAGGSLPSFGLGGTKLVLSGSAFAEPVDGGYVRPGEAKVERRIFTGGANAGFAGGSSLRAEALYADGTLPERTASTWFSYEPPLPERDFTLFAGSLAFTSPSFACAADGAFSQTFAYGNGFYGSGGLRFGNRPWRLSLAADGAGSRYTGPDGGTTRAGLRFAARVERRGKRNELLRFDAIVHATEEQGIFPPGGDFWELAKKPNRFSGKASYRFPVPVPPLRPAGVRSLSLQIKDDRRDPQKETVTADAAAGLRLWELAADSSAKLVFVTGDSGIERDSWSVKEKISWSGKHLQCGGALGYTSAVNKEPAWDASLYGALRYKKAKGKEASLRGKIEWQSGPGPFSYTVSWLCKL